MVKFALGQACMTKKSHGTNTYCIGVENGIWVKETCREVKDFFNGLKREYALDGRASVHWMDRATSIRLKFMCPSDGHPRFNSIEIGVSMDRRKGRIGKTIPAKLRKGVVLGVLCGIIPPVV